MNQLHRSSGLNILITSLSRYVEVNLNTILSQSYDKFIFLHYNHTNDRSMITQLKEVLTPLNLDHNWSFEHRQLYDVYQTYQKHYITIQLNGGSSIERNFVPFALEYGLSFEYFDHMKNEIVDQYTNLVFPVNKIDYSIQTLLSLIGLQCVAQEAINPELIFIEKLNEALIDQKRHSERFLNALMTNTNKNDLLQLLQEDEFIEFDGEKIKFHSNEYSVMNNANEFIKYSVYQKLHSLNYFDEILIPSFSFHKQPFLEDIDLLARKETKLYFICTFKNDLSHLISDVLLLEQNMLYHQFIPVVIYDELEDVKTISKHLEHRISFADLIACEDGSVLF